MPTNTSKKSRQTRRREPKAYPCVCGNHFWATLTKGFVTLVDPGDSDLLAAFVWFAKWDGEKGPYATRNASDGATGKRKTEFLHRAITGAVGDAQVDHENHNGLDNRRNNLRPATPTQNGGNRRLDRGKAVPFKGVSIDKRRTKKPYYAFCQGKSLGTFATPEEAARVYDRAAIETFGEFALTNAQMGLV